MRLCYFARVREELGLDHETLPLPQEIVRVDLLVAHLIALRGSLWAETLRADRILVAVNQQVAAFDSVICDNDEVAFFPPMTGG